MARTHRILPELPSAVIRGILRHGCPSSGKRGAGDLNLDLPATVRYSLVSRSWREEAKKLIFHQIDFTSMRRFILMRTFMRTAPTVATHVRVLSLSIGQNYHTHVQGTELPDVMNMFPYLYELRLHLDDPPTFNTETIQQLKSTPPIRALRITLSEADQCPDVLFQILQVPWPLLHLSVARPFASEVYWMTEESIQEQEVPPWKLTEYRTDGFLGYEVLLEWVVLNSLETLTVLHVPPDPRSTPLTLVSPRLRSLNLIHDPNAFGVFEGMWHYPPFPMLQELIVTNAILVPDPQIYQSVPPNVTYFATNLCTKLQTMIEICPTIPMRIDSITVYHDSNQARGWEDIVNDHRRMDPRLIMRRRQANAPCLVPLRGFPRDDAWSNKRAMDQAVSGRIIPLPQNTTSTPWWLLLVYNALSATSLPLPAAFTSRSGERPVISNAHRATFDLFKPLPEPPTGAPTSHRTHSAYASTAMSFLTQK